LPWESPFRISGVRAPTREIRGGHGQACAVFIGDSSLTLLGTDGTSDCVKVIYWIKEKTIFLDRYDKIYDKPHVQALATNFEPITCQELKLLSSRTSKPGPCGLEKWNGFALFLSCPLSGTRVNLSM